MFEPKVLIDVSFDRPNSTYEPGEKVTGSFSFKSDGSVSFATFDIFCKGRLFIENGVGRARLKTKLYTEKTIHAQNSSIQGEKTIPFSFQLPTTNSQWLGSEKEISSLLSSHHGKLVYITHYVEYKIIQKFFKRKIKGGMEFFVQTKTKPTLTATQLKETENFLLIQEDKDKGRPNYSISGKIKKYLDLSANHSFGRQLENDLIGELKIDQLHPDFDSIFVYLIRKESWKGIESVGIAQSTQIMSGNAFFPTTLPIHFVVPPFHVGPSLTTTDLKLEYKIQIKILYLSEKKDKKVKDKDGGADFDEEAPITKTGGSKNDVEMELPITIYNFTKRK
eukprot:TRINITY_DN11144_c0_g1_i1.p1 TRINITY_DN11144_c0_g1~~TRINITY_DN11144_c0_g1_i1.p1  ORF type:complete len:335 (+),score=89.68 TRINITY_DN11144_c0_g1_i1:116-1120(+)